MPSNTDFTPNPLKITGCFILFVPLLGCGWCVFTGTAKDLPLPVWAFAFTLAMVSISLLTNRRSILEIVGRYVCRAITAMRQPVTVPPRREERKD